MEASFGKPGITVQIQSADLWCPPGPRPFDDGAAPATDRRGRHCAPPEPPASYRLELDTFVDETEADLARFADALESLAFAGGMPSPGIETGAAGTDSRPAPPSRPGAQERPAARPHPSGRPERRAARPAPQRGDREAADASRRARREADRVEIPPLRTVVDASLSLVDDLTRTIRNGVAALPIPERLTDLQVAVLLLGAIGIVTHMLV